MSGEAEAGADDGVLARRFTSLAVVLGGLAVAVAVVLWWSSDAQRTPPEAPDGTRAVAVKVGSAASERYVGKASCLECHPGECAAFSRSGHARTLRPAAKAAIANWLDGRTVKDPERPEVSWTYHLRDGQLGVDRSERGKTESFPIEFSFGSGTVGYTFVTTMKSGPGAAPIGLEHRLSYMKAGEKLAITPGQNAGTSSQFGTRILPYGRLLDEARLLSCFDCHVTTGSSEGRGRLDTATMIPNVTCERCHGPAGAHVEAARRGGSEEELRLSMGPDRDSPTKQLADCGECHRSSERIETAVDPDNLAIVRFQPVGLAESACFQKGQSGLRCTSCHDAHAKVSRDTASYEAVCIDCHRSGSRVKTLCPVSPAKGCLDCHMPRVRLTPEFTFTDHWIRVRAKASRTAHEP